ncbi:MAG: gliding motility-associated C-terminal domain-containing protein [Opitutaceae bacterium]|nr:gliding motility-associated C-terminal domain-containing protein [Cytophagales bacterium]
MLQLVASSGGSVGNKNIFFDFTVGEVAIPFLNSSNSIVNVGYIQLLNIKPVNKPESIPTELKVYEFITPNNDGKNETLIINGIHLYPENELIIFDKEGELVYRRKNYDNSWDGASLPSDNYFYVFTANENLELKGGLVLTR